MLYTRHLALHCPPVSPNGSCAHPTYIGVGNNENRRERARFCVGFGLENYFILPFVNFEVHGGLFQNFEPNQIYSFYFNIQPIDLRNGLFNEKTIYDLGKGDVL